MLGPRRATTVQPRRNRRRWWVTALGLVALFVVVNAIRPIFGDARPDDATGSPPAGPEATGDVADPPPPWAVLALATAGGVALVAAILAGRRLRDAEPGEATPEPDALLVALDASIDDLERERDPRAAVIAAYARLLEGFERAGLGRRPAETPLEHLRRGLAALPLRPGPAERLTDLFLEARFSSHPIGTAERDEAHAALLAARHDLAASVTP
jgi:hypothetical protein